MHSRCLYPSHTGIAKAQRQHCDKKFKNSPHIAVICSNVALHYQGFCICRSGVAWLSHWGRDKMDAISQTTFSSAFSWMKMFQFQLKFHWSLFPRVQLTIFQHSRVTLYTAGHLHTAVPHCSHSRAPIVHTAVPQENNEHGCVYLRCRAVCKLPGCVEGHPWHWFR